MENGKGNDVIQSFNRGAELDKSEKEKDGRKKGGRERRDSYIEKSDECWFMMMM